MVLVGNDNDKNAGLVGGIGVGEYSDGALI